MSHDVERRSGVDRRELPPWLNPPFILQMLVQIIAVVAIIVSTRNDVANVREQIAELKGQVATLQSLVQVTTEQKGQIEALKTAIEDLKRFHETQDQIDRTYEGRLARLEGKR